MSSCWEVLRIVELEHAQKLLGSMGFETAATLLDAQMER